MKRTVWVIRDETPGHINQSLGLAAALADLGGARVEVLAVPLWKGLEKLRVSRGAASLKKSDRLAAESWLKRWRGEGLIQAVEEGRDEGEQLFLSAGSSAAPYTLALARFFGGRSCVCMNPARLGVDAFDWAVVPAHDDLSGPNCFVTLGAPNRIVVKELQDQGRELLAEFPAKRSVNWAVALGGDDATYKLTPEWMARFCRLLVKRAEKAGAGLYITTSRRTSREAEAELVNSLEGHPALSMLLLASQDKRNPIPGMMGCCDLAFTTEDSVSMISEVATAGVPLAVLELPRRVTLGRLANALRGRQGRMAENVDRFVARGLCAAMPLEELASADLTPKKLRPRGQVPFNEARRAARWILDQWKGGSV